MQTTQQRSALMRRFRGKGTKPEMMLRKALRAAGAGAGSVASFCLGRRISSCSGGAWRS
jgi:hypothetical protein